jgi:hypothetical protein
LWSGFGRGLDLNLCRRSVDLFEFLTPLRSAAMKPAYGFATLLVRGGRFLASASSIAYHPDMPDDVQRELDEAIAKVLASKSRKKLVVAGPGAGRRRYFGGCWMQRAVARTIVSF